MEGSWLSYDISGEVDEPNTGTFANGKKVVNPVTELGDVNDALPAAISNCWNVGSLSSESFQTSVTVAFDMSRDGRPVAPSIRLVSSSGGSANGAKQAYEAARRAIIRCTKNGYKLPLEKYDEWKENVLTFNPNSSIRIASFR